jgi:hypothetical protein
MIESEGRKLGRKLCRKLNFKHFALELILQLNCSRYFLFIIQIQKSRQVMTIPFKKISHEEALLLLKSLPLDIEMRIVVERDGRLPPYGVNLIERHEKSEIVKIKTFRTSEHFQAPQIRF